MRLGQGIFRLGRTGWDSGQVSVQLNQSTCPKVGLQDRGQFHFHSRIESTASYINNIVWDLWVSEGMVTNSNVILIVFPQLAKLYLYDPGVLQKYSFYQK